MESQTAIALFNKTAAIIYSCKTVNHLLVTYRYMHLLAKNTEVSTDDILALYTIFQQKKETIS